MKTLDVTLLFPEQNEVTTCYKMGLKSIQIEGCILPVFYARSEKKNIFIEKLKDEFGEDIIIDDLGSELDSKHGIVNAVYNSLKGEMI
jgi:hypothetical protein